MSCHAHISTQEALFFLLFSFPEKGISMTNQNKPPFFQQTVRAKKLYLLSHLSLLCCCVVAVCCLLFAVVVCGLYLWKRRKEALWVECFKTVETTVRRQRRRAFEENRTEDRLTQHTPFPMFSRTAELELLA